MTTHTNWNRVAAAVTARMDALGILDQAELVRRSGLSDPFVRGIMNGAPRGEPRPQSIRRLTKALGWSPDSIDRLRAGKQPVEVDAPVHSWQPDQPDVATLIARIDSFMDLADERRDDITEMLAKVSALSAIAETAVEVIESLSAKVDHIDTFVRRREAALARRPGELD